VDVSRVASRAARVEKQGYCVQFCDRVAMAQTVPILVPMKLIVMYNVFVFVVLIV